jgi:DNA-binding protein H-NS
MKGMVRMPSGILMRGVEHVPAIGDSGFIFLKMRWSIKISIDSLRSRLIRIDNDQIIAGDTMNNLKSMSVDKLTKLREQVNAVLGAKVAEERRTLEERLDELGRLTASGSGTRRNGAGARGAVAPKYRNPDNPAETWAGRGLKPRWLAASRQQAGGLQYRSDPEKTEGGTNESPSKTGRGLMLE